MNDAKLFIWCFETKKEHTSTAMISPWFRTTEYMQQAIQKIKH